MTVLAVTESRIPEAAALMAALEALPPHAPVVILIHGFRYAPGVAGHDPHHLILAAAPAFSAGRIVSWPRHLRLTGKAGLAIGFGWNGRGGMRGGGIWGAYARARAAGVALAGLIAQLRAVAPDRPVHVVAHSLGVRVALAALPWLEAGDVGRMILIAGAAFRAEAAAAMATPGGRGTQVLHVRGGENGLFELLLCAAFPLAGRSLGAGLPGVPGWVDLAPDRPEAAAMLARLGHRIGVRRRRVCHWSGYTRPGMFGLYRAVLAGRVPVAALAQAEPEGWLRAVLAGPLNLAPDPR